MTSARNATLTLTSLDTECTDTGCRYADCCYAECRGTSERVIGNEEAEQSFNKREGEGEEREGEMR
jgi:hypothetical protein